VRDIIIGTGSLIVPSLPPIGTIISSCVNKILKLPDNTEIYPGHDYGIKNISILAWEKEHNSVLMCKSKDEFVKLVG